MSSVDSWLLQQHTDGNLESEGIFTLEPGEAVRKLTQFGLESREQGLLRLVQFAIRGRCGLVRLSVNRHTVQLDFPRIDKEFLDIKRLAAQLTLEENNFALALLACLQSGFSEGVLRHGETLWHFDHQGFRRGRDSSPNGTKLSVILTSARPEGFWERLKVSLRMRCLDLRDLRSALCSSSVPVLVDGQDVRVDSRPSSLLGELILIATMEYLGSSVRWRNQHRVVAGRSLVQKAELNFFGGNGRAQGVEGRVNLAHLWVAEADGSSSVIKFVRDGIVIEEIVAIHKGHQVGGVVSSHGLDTDLSGLKLVRNEKFDNLCAYLFGELEKTLVAA